MNKIKLHEKYKFIFKKNTKISIVMIMNEVLCKPIQII